MTINEMTADITETNKKTIKDTINSYIKAKISEQENQYVRYETALETKKALIANAIMTPAVLVNSESKCEDVIEILRKMKSIQDSLDILRKAEAELSIA